MGVQLIYISALVFVALLIILMVLFLLSSYAASDLRVTYVEEENITSLGNFSNV